MYIICTITIQVLVRWLWSCSNWPTYDNFLCVLRLNRNKETKRYSGNHYRNNIALIAVCYNPKRHFSRINKHLLLKKKKKKAPRKNRQMKQCRLLQEVKDIPETQLHHRRNHQMWSNKQHFFPTQTDEIDFRTVLSRKNICHTMLLWFEGTLCGKKNPKN